MTAKLTFWAAFAARWLEAFIAVLFLAIAAAVVGLVILRYVFNEGVIGSDEAVRIMFTYTTALGAAVAAGRGDHIAITAGIDLLPPPFRRAADVLILLLVALINAVMFWHSLGWVEKTGAYLMPALQLPQGIKQICVPVGCGAASLFCLAKALCVAVPPEEEKKGGGQ